MNPSLVKQFPEDPSTLMTAPLWRRFAAMLYDSLLVLAVWFVTTMVYLSLKAMVIGVEAMKILAESERGLADPILSSCLFLSTYYFFAYFWTRIGQTLGMQVWRIRIQNPDGFKVNWSQSLLRLFTAIVSAACFGLGYLWIYWDKEKLTWPDRASLSRIYYIPPNRNAKPSSEADEKAPGSDSDKSAKKTPMTKATVSSAKKKGRSKK